MLQSSQGLVGAYDPGRSGGSERFSILGQSPSIRHGNCLKSLPQRRSLNSMLEPPHPKYPLMRCEHVCAKSPSCFQICATIHTVAHQALRPWDTPGKNGVACHALLQGIFTQGSTLISFAFLPWQPGSLPLAAPAEPCLQG